MKTFICTLILIILGGSRTLADDPLWQKLNEQKIQKISVIYLSNTFTTRTSPSADFVKNHYTHSFVDRGPSEGDPFFHNVKNLLMAAQPMESNSASHGDFRWCMTMESSSSLLNSSTEIYLSQHPGNYVARIGGGYYKLEEKSAALFFEQFGKLFGFER